MKQNTLKVPPKEGKVVFGPFMKTRNPAMAEITGIAGFDFVILDTEHDPVGVETMENLIRAADVANIVPIMRVGENNSTNILKALDIGAQGIEIPHISTEDDALKAVKAAKFAPQGDRGVCRFVRAASYSSTDRYQYFKMANKSVMVIIHIEGTEEIANLGKILTVKGLDVIFLGPYDLSQLRAFPEQIDYP